MAVFTKILVFSPNFVSKNQIKLVKSIEKAVQPANIIKISGIDRLSETLHSPIGGLSAAVIAPSSMVNLMRIIKFRNLLLRIPLILILPDHETETIARGHFLRPRFLSYIDSDFQDLADVLRNIINKSRNLPISLPNGFKTVPNMEAIDESGLNFS